MASWLKRAEDLFEGVDRRAKLVVSELSDEQSNDPSTASNGKVTQTRSAKAKAKTKTKTKAKAKARAEAQKIASADEKVEKEDRRLEESSSQPSVSDSKPEETVISTLADDGLTPETSKIYSNIEQHATTENSAQSVPTCSDNSSNEARKHDTDQIEAAPSPNDEIITSSSNNELSTKDALPVSKVILPSSSTALDIELDGGNNRIDPDQSSRLKDSDDTVMPREEKSHYKIDDTPSVASSDGKKAKATDDTSELLSNNMKKEDGKTNTDMNKVEEQLDEAQGLLKSTNSSGQSKEARLARVCAGLSSRLQEYKSENAQLEELLTAERELSKSCEDQIKQLQQDLSAARKELNRSESNMADALAAKNKEIESLVTSLDALKKQVALSEGNMTSLQANMETLMRNSELTETRMMQALREELALAERRAEEERVAHSATKKAAMEREVELEHRAVEASTALARTQRMADERAAKAGELEQKVAMLEVECASLNQELQDMEARLRREQKKSPEDASQLIQIQVWQEEVERARQGQRDAESKVSSLDAEVQKMRVEMAAMKRDAEHYSRQEHMELEKRYRKLTDLLYYKQTQLETMASEKAAADFQLEKEIKRLKEAQAEAERSKISRRTSSSTWDEEADMKELEPLPLHQRHLIGASMQLRKAAKFLDSGAVRATRVLWRYPRVRLGLILYLVFVHLFLMYLLHCLQGYLGRFIIFESVCQAQTDEFAAQEVARSMGLSQPNLP